MGPDICLQRNPLGIEKNGKEIVSIEKNMLSNVDIILIIERDKGMNIKKCAKIPF